MHSFPAIPHRFPDRVGWQGWHIWWPEADRSSGIVELVLPFWIPFVLLAVSTVILWGHDRRIPPGHCAKCGYNLPGNTPGVCPECGERL